MGYGGRRPGFKSWLYCWLVVESWASYLVIWSLDFLTCNMVVTSTSESVEVKQDNAYKVLISTLPCRSVQFSCSVVSNSATPWTAARQASLSITKLLESTQPMHWVTHVHCVDDAIQPSHPLLSPSPPALNLSQHQGLFKWVRSWDQVAKVLEFQLQHQSLQWTPRTDLL